MSVPVQVLFDNVLLAREEEERYAGTLVIPETAKEKPMGARVLGVGPDCKVAEPGMFVVVGRFSGADLKFNHIDYTVIRETEILGVVNERAE